MFVFPMAGMSKRFSDAGFSVPKYMLSAHGRSLFYHSVFGFRNYFKDWPFLFIARDVAGTREFIASECDTLGIANFEVVILDQPTRGQAETVKLGLERSSCAASTPVTIFNIDTFRRDFLFPIWALDPRVSGYLEVFRGAGVNWSYVQVDDNGRVVRTTEKVPISDMCSTGLYHFQTCEKFMFSYDNFTEGGGAARLGLSELFVAPMYNMLIEEDELVKCEIISSDDVLFCGVPAEYAEFIAMEKMRVWAV